MKCKFSFNRIQERGTALLEYAILVGILSLTLSVCVTTLGNSVQGRLTKLFEPQELIAANNVSDSGGGSLTSSGGGADTSKDPKDKDRGSNQDNTSEK